MKPIIPSSGDWVGPPVLVLKLLTLPGELILDGRKRLAEHRERGLRYEPPRYVAKSHLEAMKILVHNGHQQRAADHALTYAPEFIDKTTAFLQSAFDVSHQRLIPFMKALHPENRHKIPRQAIKVVTRLKRLEDKIRTEGRKATADELLDCLGEFIRE